MTNDGLTGFKRAGGAEGGDLVPNLAVALPHPTDGGKTYTFRLRRGIRYSTGELVRPADFRRAIERSVGRGDPGPGRLFFGDVLGAARCSPARCDLSRGVIADDSAWTVTFKLTRPDPDLPYKLALPVAFAVPASASLPGKVDSPLPATGPYMIARYVPKRSLTLVRNPRFHPWGSAARLPGIPDRIVWTLTGSPRSPASRVAAVERGTADVAGGTIDPTQHPAIETRFASQLHTVPSLSTFYVFLNTRLPPFDDVRVRRAVNYALDRSAIVQLSGGGEVAQPTCQVLPPGIPGYAPYCPYTRHPGSGTWSAPDLVRARRELRGVRIDRRPVTLWWPAFLPAKAGNEIIRTLQVLGYRARLTIVTDPTKYFRTAGSQRHRMQAGGSGWVADYPAPSGFITGLFTCASARARSTSNFGFFCDHRVDRAIGAAAAETTDPAVSSRLWAEIDRRVVDEAPWIFLDNQRISSFVSARVQNFQWHPEWGILLDQLWVR
jgi:peptide/nickel transport system substrate-binding protein